MKAAPLESTHVERATALKRKVLDRLTDIRRHFRALEAAMAEFGEGFPQEAFVEAGASEVPRALNRVKAVERGLDQLFNYLAELSRLGLELAATTFTPPPRTSMRRLASSIRRFRASSPATRTGFAAASSRGPERRRRRPAARGVAPGLPARVGPCRPNRPVSSS